MSETFDRLKSALADRYAIERELGAGGMATVYLAEDLKHRRKVAVKVLRPELAAALGTERFHQEIEIAAQLHHPHILPLYDSGEAEGFLYYVMPYEAGPSLREKLVKEGELPIQDAVRILRDIVDALAYAHEHGLVHRDIKPDNVMLSGRHALVTDFGVAKAVSEATGVQQLTTAGLALGTPAYMAPEQAAADPHIDHRADIYAVGALAYELLAGSPPFTGPTQQAVLAAQVADIPDPVAKHRESVPPALESLVMRCLAKKPADRWQSADEMLSHLEALATPSGAVTPTGTQPVDAVNAELLLRRNHPMRVVFFFALIADAVLAVTYILVMQLGLPYWVLGAAAVLLAASLPLTLLTGRAERRRAKARLTGAVEYESVPESGHWLTWRKLIMGGTVAASGLAVVTVIFMVLRFLGIGPAGTLMTTGVLDQQERVILADFENRTADSTLGETVTELLRIDLSQSPVLVVLEPSQIDQILRHMEHPAGTRVSSQIAQDAAEREGIKAYVTGDVISVGSGFVVSVRLIAAVTGDALVSHREQAGSADEIVDAVDRLSATLRGRVGESLRTVRADPPLERVTTSSMEALRLYVQGCQVGEATAEYDRGIQLLQQAVELDSTFAMAYRKLAAWNSNADRMAQADTAATRAYELRSRVGDRERWLIEAAYHSYVSEDEEAEENAYQSLLDKYPNDPTALHNLSITYRSQGRTAEAADLLLRTVRNGGATGISYNALIYDLGNLGRDDEVEEVLEGFKENYPNHPNVGAHEVHRAYHRGDLETAELRAREWLERVAGNPQSAMDPYSDLASLAALRGRLAESLRHERDATNLEVEWYRDRLPDEVRDNLESLLESMLRLTELEARLRYGVGPPVTTEIVDREMQSLRENMPDSLFPTGQFLALFAQLGEADRAQDLLSEIRERIAESDDRGDPWAGNILEGRIALARGDAEDAGRLFREFRDSDPYCKLATCLLVEIGMAFDRAGSKDSAVVYFERYLTEPDWGRLYSDAEDKPTVLRRLGELYEEIGDFDRAVEYYVSFVELWENADPELQPLVEDARARIARLVGEPRG